MKKPTIPNKLQGWLDARRRYHLSDTQIQMARELGMNPRHFGKLANERQEPWKTPLPQFIESLYLKRFGKTAPDKVVSIEDQAKALEYKKQARRLRKQQRQADESESEPIDIENLPHDEELPAATRKPFSK